MLSLGAIGIGEDKIKLFSVLCAGVLPETEEARNRGERACGGFFFSFFLRIYVLLFFVCLLIGQICLFASNSDKPPFIECFPHARCFTHHLYSFQQSHSDTYFAVKKLRLREGD